MIYIIGYPEATLANDFVELYAMQGRIASILHPTDFLTGSYDSSAKFIVAITKDIEFRKNICALVSERNLHRDTFIHPAAVVHSSAKVGSGCVISPFVTILSGAKVGQDCLIAPYVMVAHKSTIGQGTLLQPGSMIAGTTTIGSYCVFGLRSSVIDHLGITDNVVVGAGSLVTKNIVESGTYVGSPARRVADTATSIV